MNADTRQSILAVARGMVQANGYAAPSFREYRDGGRDQERERPLPLPDEGGALGAETRTPVHGGDECIPWIAHR